MEIFLAVLGIAGFVIMCVGIALLLVGWKEKSRERQFARDVEAQMRYDIAYAEAAKRAADKILRERGEEP